MARLEDIYSSDGITRPNVGTFCTVEEGMTKQEDAASADVNVVLARALRGTQPIPQPLADLAYADVSAISDYRSCVDRVTRAHEAFMQLPALVRREYDNDAALFLDAFQSPEGLARLGELGVVKLVDPIAELDAAEAAVESRAERRARARELEARVEAAKAWTGKVLSEADKPK